MSENLRKLIGVAVMAAIVVVGVVTTSGDDSDFARTRNAAFIKGGVTVEDAGAQEGGGCCDETLYRLGQIEDRLSQLSQIEDRLSQLSEIEDRLSQLSEIEDRLSQIETSLQQALPIVRDAQLVDDGPTVEELLVALENFAGQPFDDMRAFALAVSVIQESRLLVGVPLQTAQQVVRSSGLGFMHDSQDGRDLDAVVNWGTRRDFDGAMAGIGVQTRNGLVSEVRSYRFTPDR